MTKQTTKTTTPPSLAVLALTALRENPENARQVFDKAALQGLADSIKSEGILQPLLVVPGESGTFTVLDGHRRFRAATLAGLATVPCIVRDDLSDVDATLAAIIANLQREGLTPWEEAIALNAALATGEVTQKDLAVKTGISLRTVSSRLAMLSLGDDLGPMVGRDGFTMEHAAMLAPLVAPDFYVGLAKPQPKQTQEDADAALRSEVLKAALKAVGSGKDTLTVADAVTAVADALHAANLAYNTEKDRKTIAEAPAFLAAIKKMKHVALDSRSGVSVILVFDVATYKDKRLLYRGQAKAKGRAEGAPASKADKARLAKRREAVTLALETTLRDAIVAAKPTTSSLAWVLIHEAQARPITPGEVDFALRVANVTDEKAQNGFRALFNRKDDAPAVLKGAPKWWDALSGDQGVRLVLGLWAGNQVHQGFNSADLVQHVTGKALTAWTAEVEAAVKDEPEPVPSAE